MDFDELSTEHYSQISAVRTKTVPFHANGHVFSRKPVTEVEVTFLKLKEEVPYFCRTWMSYSCALCGGYKFKDRVTDEGVWVEGEPCPVQGGITTVVTLKVPSGKLIVDDDLRPVYNGFDHDNFADYNSVLGQAQVVEAMAKIGCAYGPVGNSCPGLWEVGKDLYVIGRMPYDEEKDKTVPTPSWAVQRASICTDLWAYSIADYEDYLHRGGKPVEEGDWATVVDVTPGTYRFTYHGGEEGFDGEADLNGKMVAFAHVSLVS